MAAECPVCGSQIEKLNEVGACPVCGLRPPKLDAVTEWERGEFDRDFHHQLFLKLIEMAGKNVTPAERNVLACASFRFGLLLASVPGGPAPMQKMRSLDSRIVLERLIDDLSDRRGFKAVWSDLDADIRADIEAHWLRIIEGR